MILGFPLPFFANASTVKRHEESLDLALGKALAIGIELRQQLRQLLTQFGKDFLVFRKTKSKCSDP